MAEVITEKNYPIRLIWIFKQLPWFILPLLFMGLPFFVIDGFNRGIIVLFVLVALSFILRVSIAYLSRAYFHYALNDKTFAIRQGIISKIQQDIPYGRIQNIFESQSIFDRMFGLASLRLETAAQGAAFSLLDEKARRQSQHEDILGSTVAGIGIPGLSVTHVKELKAILLQKIKENPIDDSQSGL